MGKYQIFSIDLGYGIDSRLAYLEFNHKEGFDSPVEAMENLRRSVHDMLHVRVKSCCRDRECKFDGINYCHVCGRDLKVTTDIDMTVAKFFEKMLTMTVDDFQNDAYQYVMDKAGWSIVRGEIEPQDNWVQIYNLFNWIKLGGINGTGILHLKVNL